MKAWMVWASSGPAKRMRHAMARFSPTGRDQKSHCRGRRERGKTVPGRSRMRRSPLALLVLIPLAAPAYAADCAGGAVRSMRVGGGRVSFSGTVTRAGLTHATAPAGGLTLTLEDADDGTPLYTLAIPAARFVTRGRATKYDRAGAFTGTVRLDDVKGQADTVRIEVRDPGAVTVGTLADRSLRARFSIGG